MPHGKILLNNGPAISVCDIAVSGSRMVTGPSGTVVSPAPMDTDLFPARVNQTPITPEDFMDFVSMTQGLILGSPFTVTDTNRFLFGVELLAEQLATGVGNMNIKAFNDGTGSTVPAVADGDADGKGKGVDQSVVPE